jgi:hypothetical protein
MAENKGRRIVITAISVAVLLLAVVGAVVLARVIAGSGEDDPYAKSEVPVERQETPTSSTQEPEPDTPSQPNQNETISPDDVSTIVVAPLSIEVSYMKGVGGFEYAILRTPSGTEYVEFRNASLVGTKCTDDEGTFAAITKNPSKAEQETQDKQVTVSGTIYGLSLSAATCTSDPDLLKQYQDAFSKPFSLLKATS